MSWSLSHKGPPQSIRKAVSDSFDGCAANYTGKLEETEVLACKQRALDAIDEIVVKGLKHLAPNGFYPHGLVVAVSAYGSHSDPDYGIGMCIHLTIEAVAADPPVIK